MEKKILFGFLLFITFNCYSQAINPFKYYTKVWNDPNLMGCKINVLIYTKGDSIKAYKTHFCDAIGGGASILKGHYYEEKSVMGFSYFNPIDENGNLSKTDSMQFEFRFESNGNQMKLLEFSGGGPVDINELTLSQIRYSFTGASKNFRDLPNTKSNIIGKIDCKKVKIELIEIGKKEEIGKTIDFWYKVRIDDKIGWLFGGLTLG